MPSVEALSIRTVAHLFMGRGVVDLRNVVERLTARIRQPRQDAERWP